MRDILNDLRDRLALKRAKLLHTPRWAVGSPEHTRTVDEVEALRRAIKDEETARKYLARKEVRP